MCQKFKKRSSHSQNTYPEISLNSFPLRNVHVYDCSKFVFNYNSIKKKTEKIVHDTIFHELCISWANIIYNIKKWTWLIFYNVITYNATNIVLWLTMNMKNVNCNDIFFNIRSNKRHVNIINYTTNKHRF